MDTFLTYAQLGLDHILNSGGYDHILFIVSLTVLYSAKEWKALLILVTSFTIGHSTTLALTVTDVIYYNVEKTEALIALSISVTALINILRRGKTPNSGSMKIYYLIALFFGFIHGMGFASYLHELLGSSGIAIPLLGFNAGLEVGQLIVVFAILLVTFFFDFIFSIKRQEIITIISAIIFGITIPMLFEHNWKIFL